PADALTVTAASSDQSVIPDDAIVLGGSGANRTVTVNPPAGREGRVTVTVTVRDAENLSASAAFTLTVNRFNTDPVLSDIPDRVIQPGQAVTIPFTVDDAETDPAALQV